MPKRCDKLRRRYPKWISLKTQEPLTLCRDDDERTALHIAAEFGTEEIVQFLLTLLPIDELDKYGMTVRGCVLLTSPAPSPSRHWNEHGDGRVPDTSWCRHLTQRHERGGPSGESRPQLRIVCEANEG